MKVVFPVVRRIVPPFFCKQTLNEYFSGIIHLTQTVGYSNWHLFEFPAYLERFSFPMVFPEQTLANIHQLFEPAVIRNFVYSQRFFIPLDEKVFQLFKALQNFRLKLFKNSGNQQNSHFIFGEISQSLNVISKRFDRLSLETKTIQNARFFQKAATLLIILL